MSALLGTGQAQAASFDARVEALFRSPLAEQIALSPDGRYVAYTTPESGRLAIAILDLENPNRNRIVPVEPDGDAPGAERAQPMPLRFLHWASATRLVYAPIERVVPLPPLIDKDGHSRPNPDGPMVDAPILAVDADGNQRGTVIDARYFQETPANALQSLADLLRTPTELAATRNAPVHWRMPHLDIVGFLPSDRNQLIVRTHGAYSMPMLHLVDLRLGNMRDFGDNWPAPPDEPQVFDWFRQKIVGERAAGPFPATRWHDEDLGRMQRELAAKFPRRFVEILDWSDTHTRVLFRVTGGNDPGRIFIYQRLEDLALEILRRAPWLDATTLNPTRWFEFEAADGAHLSGYLTWPNKPRTSPPPLLVEFPATSPGHRQHAFDPEAQDVAELGFAVARLNQRSGPSEEASAAGANADQIAMNDARAVIDWIAARQPDRPLDLGRIAALGHGQGGYLAARALQLEPALFRCGIAIDMPPDSPSRMNGAGGTQERLDIESTPRRESRPDLYRRLEGFLNRHLGARAAAITAAKETP